MSFVSGPDSISMASAVLIRSRIARASSARRSESCFEVVMTSRWRSLKAALQWSRQASRSSSSSGQVRWSVSSRATCVEVERRVKVVPAEHLERGKVAAVPRPSRSGQRRSGVPRPRRSWKRRAGRRQPRPGARTLLAEARFLSATWPRMRRSATTGRRFGSNLTKKMPQGWPVTSGRRRLISWILAAFFASIPSSSGVYSKVNSSKSSESIGQQRSSRR